MSRMLQEIAEQPEALERTIRAERTKVVRIAQFLKRRDIDLIAIVARGSSDNAALFGRYLLEITTGIPVSLCAPSVYTLYGAKLRLSHALVIGVSQSGEGRDIGHVLAAGREGGAHTIAITNEPTSPLAGIAHETLLMHGGKEHSVAATKTFTGQMLLLHMLASALADDPPEFAYDALPDFTAQGLALQDEIKEIVKRYMFMQQCIVVGRGLIYANAYEMALKLMETCYVVAERFSSADFQHGPLALIERLFPTFIFAPPGKTLEGSHALLHRLRELRADSLVISSDEAAISLASRAIRMPSAISEFLTPIPYIVPGQLFAALLATEKGVDPDLPRSLSKVTQTL